MLLDQNLVDAVISSEGTNIRAHRLILSANSSYFKSLFDSLEANRCQIPIIILKDVPLTDLKAIIEFMYRGEVCVEEKQLSSVLKSAELLKVFGLTEVCLALRSRLNTESPNEKSPTASGATSHKRPRISEGVKQTAQQSNELFSNLSNARFEIRPSHSANNTQNIESNQQQLRTITASAVTTSPSVVKNVILPSSQIHKKNSPSKEAQVVSKVTTPLTTGSNNQAITASELSPTVTTFSFGQKSIQNAKQSPIVRTISSNTSLTSTWTPSQHTLTQSASQSSSAKKSAKAPIEVLIDDSTHESFQCNEDNDDIDIKPPIFELNNNLNLEKEVMTSGNESNSSKKVSKLRVNISKTDNKTKEIKSSTRLSIKSRSSSTSSQSSLPPPPSYRVVQRSSTRLLRNIIKPTACITSSASTSKVKDSDEKAKTHLKKDKAIVRLIRPKSSKIETDLTSGSIEMSPEIECPSCGEKFTDEKKWTEHIANVHLPLHT